MFYLPIITESPIFVSLSRRLRNLKVFIPLTIAVIAYAIVIANIIATQGRPRAPGDTGTGAPPTLPPGGQEGGTPTDAPTQSLSPGSTAAPTSPGATTPRASPGATTAPGGGTTGAPTTPTSGTTKAPTTGPATTGVAGTTGTSGTTKAPTTAAATTKAPTTPSGPTPPPTPPLTAAPGGTFPANETSPVPPAELGGKRGFCFRNSCKQTVWVGQIGGATGVSCAGGCPAGTICNEVDPTLGCYFSLPFPTIKVQLNPGQLWCLPFNFDPVKTTVHMPTGDINLIVQWSGAIYASTGCDGDMNCQTGVCKNCPSYRGPVGPVAQGELTLSAIWKDYYDTTLIHGANLALAVKPMSHKGAFFPDQWAPAAYHCKAPGGVETMGDHHAASWKFNTSVTIPGRPASSVLPLVIGGSGKSCTVNSDCVAPEVCGGRMVLTADNKPTPDLTANICGTPQGVWSRSEVCGWTDANTFGDCKEAPVSGSGTMQKLYKCDAPHQESCIQPSSTSMCCGCTVWEKFIPVHAEECKNHNPVWEQYVQPHLEQIKRACPSCYTFPYDDSTALYTCWDDDLWNAASYEFEWCPNGVQITYI